MVNKKLLEVITGVVLLSSLCLTACTGIKTGSNDNLKKIGITQIVEHGALDEARAGFIED